MTKQYLDTLFEYRDGKLFWIKKVSKKIIAGQRAGAVRPDGYRSICHNGKTYQEHHLVWCIVYGSMPSMLIDHVNGVRDDNRIENIRLADRMQNAANADKWNTNTSGYKGVSFNKRSQKWVAYISVNKRVKHLGSFDTVEAAKTAHQSATKMYCGEFANEKVLRA